MSYFKWLLGPKEKISNETLSHSSKGDYQSNGRIKSGGHGEECIKHLKKNNIKFNIVKIYKNGVRVGNIPNHKEPRKRTGLTQTWFPQQWSRNTIKRAGQVVARGKKLNDGVTKFGHYGNVNVGIIRTNGKISTIFPTSTQYNRKGIEIREYRKIKKIN